MEPYSYPPLGPKEIRVLVLLPGQAGEPLEGHLLSKIFDPPKRAPRFEALSYAWGAQLDAEEVSVINKSKSLPRISCVQSPGSVSIGQNLAIALHHLRLKDKPRTLWCDSICINQGDLAERAAQIPRMGDTFTYATRVIVWLGPEADGSTLALQALPHLGKQVVADFHEWTITPAIGADRFTGSKIEPPLLTPRMGGYLCSRFSGMALIICGNAQAKWDDVACGAFCILQTTPELPMNWDDSVNAEFGQNIQRFFSLALFRQKKAVCAIKNLISTTRHCDCSEPHDRVYAILGLLNGRHKLAIKPDYTQSPKEVYRSVVLSYLEKYHVLHILDLCEIDESPSWVADLQQLKRRPAIFPNSSASSEACAVFKVTGNKLEVRGIFCGLVSSSAAYELVANDTNVQQVVRDLSIDFLGHTPDDWNIESVRALCETLLCKKVTAKSYPTFEEVLQVLKQWTIGYDSGTILCSPETERKVSREILEKFAGRSCRRMDDGAFLLSSRFPQPGDLVYIILGCRVPLILRRNVDSEYSIVGPCYHSRYMCGEALLGELPAGWSYKFKPDERFAMFINENSGISRKVDPRLSGIELPQGWCEGGTSDTGYTWWYNLKENLKTWRDPRTQLEALEERGLQLETLVLV
ncbi:heterokaryon incompatibility protein-domain-containing protein [Hypoxylon sp. FL1857]|nr:heterokaryon incompatibility protein-domain-containing protein [Hypoxylon sp. FL1857]